MDDSLVGNSAVDPALAERIEAAWRAGSPLPIESLLPPPDAPDFPAMLESLVRAELEVAWRVWGKTSAEDMAAGGATLLSPPMLECYVRRFPALGKQPDVLRRLVEWESSLRRRFGSSAAAEPPAGSSDAPIPRAAAAGAGGDSTAPREAPMGAVGALRGEGPMGNEAVRVPGGARAPGPPSGGGLPPMSLAPGASPPAGTAPSFSSMRSFAALGPGATFGNYELLGELGRGGMGVVYKARQRTADRVVALKVIRADRLEALPRDTQTSAIDRFRHEAQAAARIEHDNIVTVYEVGEIEGQNFFSMRYVEGQSLAEMLRAGPIENRRAAGYLEPVARAVAEAHRHGILHRDLKPQNILVDAKADRALVADFGLAKLCEGREELTQAGEVMGTPSYMSPEQARDSAHVTAATDVYALGATLYHMLTARPPFQAANPVETLRQVLERDPALPRQLNPAIDRDLETICLKCLEKEPARRYPGAAELADDLRRYLDGRPIVARPIGPAGRFWRWCRRNPVVAALAATAIALLFAALAATSIGYVRTSRALVQRDWSDRQARAAFDEFFTTVAEDTLMNQPGMQPVRRELLDKALRYYRRFLAERRGDPTIGDEVGKALFRVALVTEEIQSPEAALPTYREALEMQRSLAAAAPNDPSRLRALGDTLNALGRVHLRLQQLDASLAAYEEAVATRRTVAELDAGDREARRALANALMNRGLVEKELGRFDAAQALLDQAQRIRGELLREDAEDLKTRRDLAMGCFNLADVARSAIERGAGAGLDWTSVRENLEAAAEHFERVLAAAPKDLANQERLVVVYRQLGDLEKFATHPRNPLPPERRAEHLARAADYYGRALRQAERLATRNPDVAEYQNTFAAVHLQIALLALAQGEPARAIDSLGLAIELLDRLVEQCPNVPRYRRDLASALRHLGRIERREGRAEAARRELARACEEFRRLSEQFPETPTYQAELQATETELRQLDSGAGDAGSNAPGTSRPAGPAAGAGGDSATLSPPAAEPAAARTANLP